MNKRDLDLIELGLTVKSYIECWQEESGRYEYLEEKDVFDLIVEKYNKIFKGEK